MSTRRGAASREGKLGTWAKEMQGRVRAEAWGAPAYACTTFSLARDTPDQGAWQTQTTRGVALAPASAAQLVFRSTHMSAEGRCCPSRQRPTRAARARTAQHTLGGSSVFRRPTSSRAATKPRSSRRRAQQGTTRQRTSRGVQHTLAQATLDADVAAEALAWLRQRCHWIAQCGSNGAAWRRRTAHALAQIGRFCNPKLMMHTPDAFVFRCRLSGVLRVSEEPHVCMWPRVSNVGIDLDICTR